jgi:hypothetical protein
MSLIPIHFISPRFLAPHVFSFSFSFSSFFFFISFFSSTCLSKATSWATTSTSGYLLSTYPGVGNLGWYFQVYSAVPGTVVFKFSFYDTAWNDLIISTSLARLNKWMFIGIVVADTDANLSFLSLLGAGPEILRSNYLYRNVLSVPVSSFTFGLPSLGSFVGLIDEVRIGNDWGAAYANIDMGGVSVSLYGSMAPRSPVTIVVKGLEEGPGTVNIVGTGGIPLPSTTFSASSNTYTHYTYSVDNMVISLDTISSFAKTTICVPASYTVPIAYTRTDLEYTQN